MMWMVIVAQLWTSSPNSTPGTILSGAWQSCQQDDGSYGERIYDHHVNGKWLWSFHMGPNHEFALFEAAHEPDDADDHNHDSYFNLLSPNYTVVVEYAQGKRTWTVPKLGLWINVVLAGGSRNECETFFLTIRKQSPR